MNYHRHFTFLTNLVHIKMCPSLHYVVFLTVFCINPSNIGNITTFFQWAWLLHYCIYLNFKVAAAMVLYSNSPNSSYARKLVLQWCKHFASLEPVLWIFCRRISCENAKNSFMLQHLALITKSSLVRRFKYRFSIVSEGKYVSFVPKRLI